MSIPLDEIWKWLKQAPLPVVLAVNLLLAGWVWSLAEEQAKQAEQVKSARETAEKTDKKIDRVETKVDRLLEAVADLRAEQKASRPKADGKAKEK